MLNVHYLTKFKFIFIIPQLQYQIDKYFNLYIILKHTDKRKIIMHLILKLMILKIDTIMH